MAIVGWTVIGTGVLLEFFSIALWIKRILRRRGPSALPILPSIFYVFGVVVLGQGNATIDEQFRLLIVLVAFDIVFNALLPLVITVLQRRSSAEDR